MLFEVPFVGAHGCVFYNMCPCVSPDLQKQTKFRGFLTKDARG